LALTSIDEWAVRTENTMSARRILRLRQEAMSELVIVVYCHKLFKLRFRLAMCLMRIAGRIGGFKSVKVIRKP
jgi:hypothetical protein